MPITDFERSEMKKAAKFLEDLGYIIKEDKDSINYSLNDVCIIISCPPCSDEHTVYIHFIEKNKWFDVGWIALVRDNIRGRREKLADILKMLKYIENHYFQITDYQFCVESGPLIDKYAQEHHEILENSVRDFLSRCCGCTDEQIERTLALERQQRRSPAPRPIKHERCNMDEFRKKVSEFILLCKVELANRKNGVPGESTVEQLEKVILPEMFQLLDMIDRNEIPPQKEKRWLHSFALAFFDWPRNKQKPTELYRRLTELETDYKNLKTVPTEINGWRYEYETLPYWDNHNDSSLIYDELYENQQSDTACLIYSIAEATMCNNVGFLAVLRNKNSPKLYANVTSLNFPTQEVQYSADGNYIFLKAQFYNKAAQRSLCPIFIIDLLNDRFTAVDIHANTTCSTFAELSEDQIAVVPSPDEKARGQAEVQLTLSQLDWLPISELNRLPLLLS